MKYATEIPVLLAACYLALSNWQTVVAADEANTITTAKRSLTIKGYAPGITLDEFKKIKYPNEEETVLEEGPVLLSAFERLPAGQFKKISFAYATPHPPTADSVSKFIAPVSVAGNACFPYFIFVKVQQNWLLESIHLDYGESSELHIERIVNAFNSFFGPPSVVDPNDFFRLEWIDGSRRLRLYKFRDRYDDKHADKSNPGTIHVPAVILDDIKLSKLKREAQQEQAAKEQNKINSDF